MGWYCGRRRGGRGLEVAFKRHLTTACDWRSLTVVAPRAIACIQLTRGNSPRNSSIEKPRKLQLAINLLDYKHPPRTKKSVADESAKSKERLGLRLGSAHHDIHVIRLILFRNLKLKEPDGNIQIYYGSYSIQGLTKTRFNQAGESVGYVGHRT